MILTEQEIQELSDLIERSDFFDCVVPFARAVEAAIIKKIGEPVAWHHEAIRQLIAERDHWKNNHATEVRRARILKERPDLPIERVQAYEKWRKDQDERDHYKEECLEQARLLGISGERELKLIAERDAVNTIAKRQSAILTRTGDELADCRTEIAALKAERDAALEQKEIGE